MNRLWKNFKKIFDNICIVDFFLIIFMIILFLYIIIQIISGTNESDNTNTIDVIVRTSIAAIFGYFISNNFSAKNLSTTQQKLNNPDLNSTLQSVDDTSQGQIKNQIGFQLSEISSKEELGKISSYENSPISTKQCNMVQVFIVSSIGLVALIILFITRYFQQNTPEYIAIISQLRDFVSVCIGFLISCGKNVGS